MFIYGFCNIIYNRVVRLFFWRCVVVVKTVAHSRAQHTVLIDPIDQKPVHLFPSSGEGVWEIDPPPINCISYITYLFYFLLSHLSIYRVQATSSSPPPSAMKHFQLRHRLAMVIGSIVIKKSDK